MRFRLRGPQWAGCTYLRGAGQEQVNGAAPAPVTTTASPMEAPARLPASPPRRRHRGLSSEG